MSSCLKYEQAYADLHGRILSGKLVNGMVLPREAELARQMGIGRVTLRTALARLEKEELIRRIPGKGTFITFAPDAPEISRRLPEWRTQAAGKRLLAMFGDTAEDASCAGVLLGAENRCRELGADLERFDFRLVGNAQYQHTLKQLRNRCYAGVILAASHFIGNEPVIALLKELALPVVMPFAHDCDSVTTPFTVFDVPIRKAVFTQLLYLNKFGHSRIAFIGPAGADFINGVTPYEFRDHTGTDTLFLRAVRTPEAVGQAMDELLNTVPRPTALLCIDSYFAALALDALASRHVKVPDEISVIGYGDMPGCELLNPPLTFVSPLLLERGAAAADYLLGGVEHVPALGVRLYEYGSVAQCHEP